MSESTKTRIWLDPGHGGSDPGCTAENDKITEASLVHQIASAMRQLSSETVFYGISRTEKQKPTKLARATGAHVWGAQGALVLHFNNIEDRRVNRTDMFAIGKVPPLWERKVLDLGMGLAFQVHSVTPMHYPRVWNCLKHYATFRIPTVLLEIAFLDRPVTLVYLADGGVEKLAKSIHSWVEESVQA